MDQLAALGIARSEFDRRLRAVGPGDWDRPTPCEGWTVRDLVRHVVTGSNMAASLFSGCSTVEAVALHDDTAFPEDPVAAFNQVADAAARAAAVEGAMEGTCHHPAGDFPRLSLPLPNMSGSCGTVCERVVRHAASHGPKK